VTRFLAAMKSEEFEKIVARFGQIIVARFSLPREKK
jgi:hypothetical protein